MSSRNNLQKLCSFFSDSGTRFSYLTEMGLTRWMSDEAFIKKQFKYSMGYELDLENPVTFNEKIQWLKLHDRKPIYTTMVDKYDAKEYVASIIGKEYIIPTLGVWNHFDEIDFNLLPNQFVIKCTHDSGGLAICKNKEQFDYKAAKNKIEKCLSRKYFYIHREWPYKNVKPRIIAEQYMEDHTTGELRDYKFFCFGGVARCFKVDFDRFIEHHANYFDADGNLLPFGELNYPPKPEKEISFPESFPEMKALAEKLSYTQPFLRADFYDIDGHVYFGELTFYPASGFGKFTDDKWDRKLGEWIQLPENSGGGTA